MNRSLRILRLLEGASYPQDLSPTGSDENIGDDAFTQRQNLKTLARQELHDVYPDQRGFGHTMRPRVATRENPPGYSYDRY